MSVKAWNAVGWFFGVSLILAGFGSIISGSLGALICGVIWIVAGLGLIPTAQNYMRKKLIEQSEKHGKSVPAFLDKRKTFVISSVVLVFLGSMLAPKPDQQGVIDASSAQNAKDVQAAEMKAIQPQPSTEQQTEAKGPARNPKISESVYQPYDETYKKTHNKFKGMMDEVESYRIKAAERALESGKCSEIMLSEISDEASRNNMRFFVDCRHNNKDRRIYLTQKEIDSKAPVVPVDELGLDQSTAIMGCSDEIRARTREYSDVDIHSVMGSTFFKDEKGRSKVSITFEVTNDFGVEIPYTAYCNYDADGNGEVKLQRGQ